MNKHLLTFLLILACAAGAGAQSTGDYLFSRKTSDGPHEAIYLTPEAGKVIGFSLSGGKLVPTMAAGGGGAWGSITGTLSAQTDLQAALDLKLASTAVSAFGLTLVDDANATAARTTLGLGTLATQNGTISDYLTSASALNGANLTSGTVANAALANSTMTINGNAISLGGSFTTPALSGDVTTSLGGSVTTLATVNSNVGSFGSSTAIPNFTVNGKGLVTAAGTSAVVAPAGTLSGTTLNSSVVTSSLTALGTISTGVWQATAIADSYISSATTWNAKANGLRWVWASGGGAPADYHFTTDSTAMASTTYLQVDPATFTGGAVDWTSILEDIEAGTRLVVTNGSGTPAGFEVTSASAGGGYVTIGVTPTAVGSMNWAAGEYTFSFVPGPGGVSGIGGSTGSTDNTILVADGTGGATVKAGSGVVWGSADGGTLTSIVLKPTYLRCGEAGYNPWDINAFYVRFASSMPIVWASTTDAISGSSDSGITRRAAAVVGLTDGSTGGGVLELLEVADIGTPSSNSVRIGAEDAGGTAEVIVSDEAGNQTQISPHAGDGPSWLSDGGDYGPDRIVSEKQVFTGRVRFTNETRQARLFELLLEAYLGDAEADAELRALRPELRKIVHQETFAEYNARLGLTGEKAAKQEDWDAVEADRAEKAREEIAAWEKKRDDAVKAQAEWLAKPHRERKGSMPAAHTEPKPKAYEVQEKPDFLKR